MSAIPRWVGYVVVVAVELGLTAGLLLLLPVFPLADFPVAYLLVMMVAAYTFGVGPAVVAFCLGLACYVYAFPPYHGIWPPAASMTDWAGIAALLLGSAIVWFAAAWVRGSMNRAQSLASELQSTEEHTRSVLESIAECFFSLDSDLRFVEVNRVAEALVFGCDSRELMGKSLLAAYPQLEGHDFDRRCREALATGRESHFEDPLWLRDRWFECYIFPHNRGLEVYLRDVTDRKHAEDDLRQSEARYRTLIETMNEGFTESDADYILTYVNRRLCEMLGYTQEGLLGHRIPEFLDEPSQRLLESKIPERRAGLYAPYELTWVAGDGRKVYSLVSPRPRFHKDGTFAGAFATITDISELKRSEESIRESEQKYRELFHNANDAIFLVDLSEGNMPGRFIEVNDVACKRLGYSRQELLSMSPSDIDAPDMVEDLPRLTQWIRRRRHGTFEIAQITKSGRRIPTEISAHLFEMEGNKVLLAVARDITERRRAEDQIRRTEASFRDLFDRAADCLFLHDLRGRFVEVNKSACETLGYTREELLNMGVSDIVMDYDPETLTDLWAKLAASPQTVYVTHRRKDGSTLSVEGRLSLLDYRDQVLVLAVVRDITERMRAEEERRVLEQHMEEQKRSFYRETIFSVTGGKLDICDQRDVQPYISSAEISIEVCDAQDASGAREGVERFLRDCGIAGDRLDRLMIGVGEAITNAIKHGERGAVYAGCGEGNVWVAVADDGHGIESLILPRAVLLRGFSTKPSMGLGYCIMLDVADRIHLKTDASGTTVVLEKAVAEEKSQPSLQDLPDTWARVGEEGW